MIAQEEADKHNNATTEELSAILCNRCHKKPMKVKVMNNLAWLQIQGCLVPCFCSFWIHLLGCHILFPYIFCSRFESVGLLLLFYCEIFRNRWFYRTQPVAVFVAIALDVWWMSQHVLSDQVMIKCSQGRCCLHEYKILLTVPKIDWGLYWLRHLR